MKKKISYISLLPVNIAILTVVVLLAIVGNKVITVLAVNAPVTERKTFVIDAGHGGVDGGTTSCTGVLESQYNLEIALRLNDIMHLLGMDTLLIRDTDCSVYTEGDTIAQKKISDLKERVRIVNSTENAVLISIHQNYFQDSRYHGAQVFFGPSNGSEQFAAALQDALRKNLDPDNHRQIKKADGIYLMQKIQCPGALIECGFLSNLAEEALLRNPEYQKNISAVIACICSTAFQGQNENRI